jgi:signal recognition particle receptor subunit beta
LTVEANLPPSAVPSSSRYRSENDFESKIRKRILITDTPGHSKLRHFAFNALESKGLTGVIFVVDAADLTSETAESESTALRDTATYLHDVLLALQKRYARATSAAKAKQVPVLIAANKMDLFTALPANMVRGSLEAELTRLRSTRARGIAGVGKAGKGQGLAAGIGEDEFADDHDEADNVLGGTTAGRFEFSNMREWGIEVTVAGGSVAGSEDPYTEKWWDWIAELL